MPTTLFVVIFSRQDWWVDVEGEAHGPFPTREEAAREAIELAQFATHTGRRSEVLVPDHHRRYRVTWSSSEDRGWRRAG